MLGAITVGAVAAVVAGALPAGATYSTSYPSFPQGTGLVSPANSIIIGSGSSTDYNMMQGLDTLFNQAPGCQTFVAFPSASEPQPLDQSCVANPTVAANPENPFNDVAVEEPALGSSNGIQQLEDQGAHGSTATSKGTAIPVANDINYARSSRALATTDLQGLNFVAYATDGVTWFHYTDVGGTASPSAAVKDLTQAQLEDIYINGTIDNWDEVGGGDAPIVVFSAQEGSGTQSTWKTYLGNSDPSSSTNPVNCTAPGTPVFSKTATPINAEGTGCTGPGVIFENEDASITPANLSSTFVDTTSLWGGSDATAAQIQADAIFFFSNGKYNLSCQENKLEGIKKNANCGDSPLATGTKNALGALGGTTSDKNGKTTGGVDPTETNVLNQTFPDTRYLYNVYSNGSNSNIPAATPATANYVSEIGFICNPDKGLTVAGQTSLTSGNANFDPNNGEAYLTEIQQTIEANGFYPLSAGASTGTVNDTPIAEGAPPHPATGILTTSTKYAGFDNYTTASSGQPLGYCIVFNTDGNSTS